MGKYDLQARRAARAAKRKESAAVAGREITGETLLLILTDESTITMPAEFPVAVLWPLRRLGKDLGLLMRQGMDIFMGLNTPPPGADAAAYEAADRAQRIAGASLLVDLLAANPDLPDQTIEVAIEMGRKLFGEEGWKTLWDPALNLSFDDLRDIADEIGTFYGFGPGEASGSSESSTDTGGTSLVTSTATTPGSTPELSGSTPQTPGSSESAA